jgi:hypothetical protein
MMTDRPAPWTSPAALEAVRPQVREALTAVPAFSQLSPKERAEMAMNMVKVLSYIANPSGVFDDAAKRPPLARAQENATETARKTAATDPGFAGGDFEAGAARQGVEQFGSLVKKVDFPKFVGGLINNVFRAIVETSIEQMRAYGELVAAVAKSVDEFMQDNIGVGAGRDFLANRYPDALQVEITPGEDGGKPTSRVVTRGDDPGTAMAEISREYGIDPPLSDLSDDAAEMRLVTAARMQLARQRQQLLASMVMLGINRIVVTDGSINAKVRFDMRSNDEAKREYRAAMYDQEKQGNTSSISAGFGGILGLFGGGVHAGAAHEDSHIATVSTGLDETSESKLEMTARLQGEVKVNFKSDYLPLEKMATPEMISAISGNSLPAKASPPSAPRPSNPVPGGS